MPWQDFAKSDIMKVSECVPAYMLFLIAENLRLEGMELRADIIQNLNTASIAPLNGLDDFSVRRVARRVDEEARTLLTRINASHNFTKAMISVSRAILVLAEDGKIDPHSIGALVALAFFNEVQQDSELWGWSEHAGTAETNKLLREMAFLGYFPVPWARPLAADEVVKRAELMAERKETKGRG